MRDEVILLLPSLSGGGAERVMVHYANWLVMQGQPTTLVLVNATGEYFSEIDPRVKLIDLACERGSFAVAPFFRLVQQRKPIAVLTTLTLTTLVAGVVRLISPHRFRLVLRQANTFSIDTRVVRSWKGRIKRYLAIWINRFADGHIAVSHGVAQDLATETGLPMEKIRVVHNPVDIQSISRQSQQPIPWPWPEAADSVPFLVAAGRLARQKDFATLLKAFALVRRETPCRLVILGQGPLREELEGLAQQLGIENAVLFAGFVLNPFPWISRARVLVSASRWEGFNNVLLQALACGTAVVATDCPHGACELLENGKIGRLVPVGNPAELAAAVLATLREPKQAAVLKEVAGRYDLDRQFSLYSRELQLTGPQRQGETNE